MSHLKLFIFCLVTLTAALLIHGPVEAGGYPCGEAPPTFLLEENFCPELVRNHHLHVAGFIHAAIGPPIGGAGSCRGHVTPPPSLDPHRLSILRI